VRRDLLELGAALSRRGEPFVLATVVARTPPISAQVGDVALVTRDGGFHGWVGGSCTRPTVVAEALKVLGDGRPRLVALDPNPETRRRPGLTVFPMTCHSGGSVEIHLQPVLPPPRLVIYGLSPTGRALVRLGKAMGYAVELVDPAAERSDFPDADVVLTDPKGVSRDDGDASPPLYAVVATQGQWDEEAAAAALALAPSYLAVMASVRRFGEMRALLAGTAGEASVSRISNPAGLDIGAQLPEEIALSILAEIVEHRRHTSTAGAPLAGAAGEVEARDPVCGMMVTVSGALHRAQHAGKTFFFCCGGCRERFVASPGRYLAAPEGSGALE
jgi:xanthine dehydrogenase accessory factor